MISFLIIGIILSSLAWAGDIFSWAWIGNGFIIDIIVAIVAIFLTIGTIYLYYKYQERKKETTTHIEPDSTEKTIFTCFNCGEVMSNTDDLCPSCGSPKPVCSVCFSPLEKNEGIVKLSCCSAYAHEEHIINFIEIKGHCPKCQQEISRENLIKISL